MHKRTNPLDRYARDLPSGTLLWIGVRPARRAAMLEPRSVEAHAGLGLEGDHRTLKTPGSARQVTVISREFIEQIRGFTGHDSIAPALLRRNLVISGINLNALRYQRFRIGPVLLEASALCHPCSRMEQALGRGTVAAMLGHGGLCCKILQGGTLAIGDSVEVAPDPQLDLYSPN